MNFRIICLIALVLLIFAPKQSYFNKQNIEFSNSLSPLASAYFLGDKSKLTTKQRKAHQILNLQHLMTPSGLHLSSILLIFSFLSKRSQFIFIVLSTLSFFAFPLVGFSSFKRMIIFGLLKNNPIKKISNQNCFWLTFIISFILGMYLSSPLSFTLSFIFLGAILSSGFRLQTFFMLFLVQAMISSWLEKKFFPIASVYGLTLSMLSPLTFSCLAIEAIFNINFFSSLWLKILSFLSSFKGPSLSYPILTILPCYLIGTKKRMRAIALGLSIFFSVLKLNPSFKTRSFPAMPPLEFTTKTNIKGGVKLIYKNKMRCYSRLKMDEWSTHCY